jgi:hypothetical protein
MPRFEFQANTVSSYYFAARRSYRSSRPCFSLSHPPQAVAANDLGRRGLPIEPGWVVLTGGITDALRSPPAPPWPPISPSRLSVPALADARRHFTCSVVMYPTHGVPFPSKNRIFSFLSPILASSMKSSSASISPILLPISWSL